MKTKVLKHYSMTDGYVSSFRPKYYKKVGNGLNARYFYSEQEYLRWLNKDRPRQIGMDEEIAQEKQRTANQAKEFKARTKVPDKVTVIDYAFGGQYSKDLIISRKQLQQAKKQLKQDQKEAERLLKKIRKLEASAPSESRRNKIAALKKEREELMPKIAAGMSAVNSQSREFTIALCRYESTTMIGRLGKKLKNARSKIQKIIKKYSNKVVSAINAPVISTKK